MVLECGQRNVTRGADPSNHNFSEGVDDGEDCDFDGAIVGESSQRAGLMQKLLDLQHECRTKKLRIPTNVTDAVELAQE